MFTFLLQHDEVDGQVNNIKPEVKTVTENKVATQSVGSRLCGLTSCVGGCLKSAACAVIPSLATVKALIASLLILAMPFFLNELCTKVSVEFIQETLIIRLLN